MPLTADSIGQTDAVNPAGSAAVQRIAAEGTRIRALAIDDNEEFRNLITELLEPYGVDVIAVANPVKALEKFTQEKDTFQLVLLDYYMPPKNCGCARFWPNTRLTVTSASRSASRKPCTSSVT